MDTMNVSEIRTEFLSHIKGLVEYWSSLPDKTVQERMDGLVFSILNLLDGDVSGTLLTLAPLEANPNIVMDITGELHAEWAENYCNEGEEQ
jgi:hypothetical protein